VRLDLNKGTAEMLVSMEQLARRRAELEEQGGYQFPKSHPWQEIQRNLVDQLADGVVLKPAVKYRRVAQRTVPRNSH
jgi:dihydroxy-acid dehydratase